MSAPGTPDQPEFDSLKFEAEAVARAAEFVGQVSRLAVRKPEDDEGDDWLVVRGARYSLADGSEWAVAHETWDQDPRRVVAKLRIIRPFVETPGSDGQLRRATLTRFIMYRSFSDAPDAALLAELEERLPPSPALDELGEAVMADMQWARVQAELSPGYRPAELIDACTSMLVECKLPKGPNFRIERYSPGMPADVMQAHMLARRRAGETEEDPAYDIPEHEAVMTALAAINPKATKPQSLDSDFEQTWVDPPPTLRSWRPRGGEPQ
ncbi:MAG TPA: hypothetical protein VLH84_05290 [Patescibacteria group bacterium]|nr:hypothetical protein [Patescibacteria group bacterium]